MVWKNIRLAGVCLAIGCLCSACGGYAALQQELQNPDKTLRVTINSNPPGAEVYGIKRGKPGTLLGTTPLVCSYMVVRSGHSPEILGTVPFEETIVSDWHLMSFAERRSYYSFQCVVTMDGYQTAVVKQQLVDDKPINTREFSTSDVFKGGRSFEVLVELPPLPDDSADTDD